MMLGDTLSLLTFYLSCCLHMSSVFLFLGHEVHIVYQPLIFHCSLFLYLSKAKDIMSNYRTGLLENSAKMVLLFHLIDESVRKGDKILVFR